MPPVNTYKIQLEQIQNTQAEKPIKDLATQIVTLTRRIQNLERVLEKSASTQAGGVNVAAIDLNTRRLDALQKSVAKLETTLQQLRNLKDVPDAIKKVVSAGREVAREARDPRDRELVDAIRGLVNVYKRIERSEVYKTGRETVLKNIERALQQLIDKQTRSINDLNRSVQDLSKSVGASPTAGGRRIRNPELDRDIKLFGKALKDMGTEFEKIKRELKDKMVVALDIETSEAKRIGKEVAAEFVSQIAYQKGTLQQILAGKGERGQVFVRPPRGVETEAQYKRLIGNIGKADPIPFEKLKKEGIEATEAMKKVADVLKDAEAVIGHNIAQFDIGVLEQHFQRAGIKIEAETDKFIDTLRLAREKFPQRLSTPTRRQPYALESFEKDFKLAGVETKNLTGSLHDASYDVELTITLLRALDGSIKELMAAQSDLSHTLSNISATVERATSDAAKRMKFAAQKMDKMAAGSDLLSETMAETEEYMRKAGQSFHKATLEIDDLAKIKSTIQANIFRPQVVRPQPVAEPFAIAGPVGAARSEKTAALLGDLAKSLDKLQNNIIKSLEKGLSSGAEILKDEAGKAFQLAPGQAEWELKIVDVRGLRQALAAEFREFASPEATANELIDTFKRAFVRRELGVARSPEVMAEAVYKEVGSLTAEMARSMGRQVEDLFKAIKQQTTTVGEIARRPELTDLFKGVALEAKAQRQLMQDFIKRLAVPAARIGPEGGVSIPTKYGAERALANFVTVTTGLEKLAQELRDLGGATIEVERLMRQVAQAPLRPTAGTVAEAEAEKLAATLVKKVIELGGRAEVATGYKRAIALRGLERGEFTEEQARIFAGSTQTLDELLKKADELKVSALDAARALDELSFENFYDILDKMLQAGKVPYLEKQAANIVRFDRNMREVSRTINDLLGLQPLIEPGRPKRRLYDEQSLKILTKAMEGRFRPEEQKQHIVAVNLLLKDLTERAGKLQEGLFAGKPYLGRPLATSLDLSDAASSKLKQFNEDMVTNLKALDKTAIGASLADIRAAAPFREFSSIQRQLSYVSNALAGGLPGGGQFEAPALLSAREQRIMEAGRYGQARTGLNVLTELRNTAQTFEDQIVISGRLAKAFTQITGRLVKPAETLEEAKRITAIEPGVQQITPRAARLRARSEEEFKRVLSEVTDQFQEILGVPQRYRGRADIAEISKEVENLIREHRGQTIEVQTAKLTETFLNYFGRKLSTRFGTKGVSVTPRYGELPKEITSLEDVGRFIQQGFKAGVAPGPGLGVARLPKNVGQLLIEIFNNIETRAAQEADEIDIFGGEVLESLTRQLIDSGNKFVIDLFRDASLGLVTEEEAKKQQVVFENATKAFKKVFGEELPKETSEAIRFIRERYAALFGEEQLFEVRPIEARISSRGIAKRGLMPEILEGIVNNLIGTTAGATTLSDEISRGALTETREARKKLNEYLRELGYQPFKDLDGVISRLKLEKPDIDPDTIKKLRDFEAQFSVYTDVVNEFGEQMQSFVAPKFLQIIEEPHLYPEWSPEQIQKGLKGARLDFQSFAAMAGVFGEGSKMMEELARSTALTAQEGWELLRAFQMLDPAMKDVNKALTEGLRTVSLRDVASFEKATGTVEELKGTIFDIGKFPTPFKLRIPSTAKGAKEFYEELYIPGPALRGTYQEELLGAQAPTNIARYLDNLVNAAKEVEEIASAAAQGGIGLSEEFQRKFATTIRAELTKSLTDTIKRFQQIEKVGPTPQNVEFMQQTINRFKQALSETREVAPIYQEGMATTERGAVEEFERKYQGQFSKIVGRIADILIGPDPASLRKDINEINAALKSYRETGGQIPQRFQAPYYQNILQRFGGDFEAMLETFKRRSEERGKVETVFDIELEAGNLDEFANRVGISIQQSLKEALEKRKETLGKARVAYFRELGESVFGKKKGIEEVFFQRVTPAITGKAISAIADKTRDLKDLLEELRSKYIVDLEIPGLPMLVEDLEKLSEAHSEYVTKARTLGLPVLKEGEIGLPPEMAAKIKVRTGIKDEIETTLADLIQKQSETFVESIRYPFTGTLSVQPHRARLLEQSLGKYGVAVPGAPGFARAGRPEERRDIGDLVRVVNTLREFIGVTPRAKRQYLPEETLSLLERRERAWAEGTEMAAEKARHLTEAIERLLKIVNAASPSFTNLEQKLDFDGDALFVHTGQLEESRAEIKKHFEALADDVTGVRSLFRSVFTAVKETDVATLAEMAVIFGKKHPAEKGFEFLTQPYLREQVKNLDLSKVFESLFTYTTGAGQLKAGTEEWQKAVGDWSKDFVVREILPEVFTRLGVDEPTAAAYRGRIGAAPTALPEVTETTTALERNISKLSEDLVRRQLWEKRYADAITGQLYKLHTGQTVEGISRIARISELETGFGRGLAGTGRRARPAPEFLQRFPQESVALGGRPVQEFATRVNEIMRFVIQKGMDVKHAGVEAVGQQILANIGKRGGTEFIREAMLAAKDQWDELLDFNDQIANEVRLRLGKFSTDELMRELQRFEPEVDISQLTGISREEIIQRIIKHVDVIATFEELGRQIQRQAVAGLSKQLERQIAELPTGPRKVRLLRDVQAAGGVERFAAQQIAKEYASETGIAIQKHVTTNLQPLYKMRTSMETLATAASRTGIKIEPTALTLPEAGAEKLSRDFENTQKAAHALSQALSETARGPRRGVHGLLVTSAIEQRYRELSELEKLGKESQQVVGKFALPFTDVIEANKLAVKVFQEAGAITGLGGGRLGPIPQMENLEEFFNKLTETQKIVRGRVAEISKLAGLKPLVPEEEALIGRETIEKYGIRPFEVIKDVLTKEALTKGEEIVPEELENRASELATAAQEAIAFQASVVEQLRRVTEIIKTIPEQRKYLEAAFPDVKFEEGATRIATAQMDAVQRFDDYTKAIENWHKQTFPTTRTNELRDAVRTFRVPATTAGEELKKTTAAAADELTTAIDESIIARKRDALKYLEGRAAGPAAPGEVPLHEIFRASAVHAGGGYGGGTQLESILQEMLGAPKGAEFLLEATSLRGTALHRRKQREFLAKYPTAEIEKPIEDLANRITGHIDVLYEEAGRKIVADVKTVYSTAQFKRLEEIADEVQERNITIQQKLDELKAQEPTSQLEKNVIRRLEEYISQVNIYLSGVEDAVGELVVVSTFDPKREVTIPIGEFDPTRFKRDLAIIQEGRTRVTKLLALIQSGQVIPKELFADVPKIYDYVSKELEKLGPEEFLRKLPTRPIGEVQRSSKEIIDRLTEEQDRLFDKISREYLGIYQSLGGPGVAERPLRLMFAAGAGAAAPPPPPPPPGGAGGGPGDGFDDEELRKRIQEILARIERGIKPEVPDIYKLIQTLDEALEGILAARERGDTLLAGALEDLVNNIRAAIQRIGASEESYREIYQLYQKLNEARRTGAAETGFARLRMPDIERIDPDTPEALHKNLRALYEAALRVHRLASDEEIQKFGPEIASLLSEAAEKGPVADITGQISDAITQLPPEKRGGMRRIWMHYKSSVSEYFLKRLDALKEEIEKEAGTPAGRRALIEYEQTVERFLANIRGTLGRLSDIYTQIGPSGKKTAFVDPELARLTGIYRTPAQLEELVTQTTPLRGELKPIIDILVGDLDPTQLDQIASPLQKVQAAFRLLAKEDPNLKAILEDADQFRRIGDQALEAWDFAALTKGITELRAALQAYNRLQIGAFGGGTDYTEPIRKNVEDTIKLLRQIETMFAPGGVEASPLGLAGVPSFLDPQTQELLHRRNIAQVQKYFETPEAAGGPGRGRAFTYRYKIVDPATKQTLSSLAEEFKKIGETSSKSGDQIGIFTQRTEDLIKSFQSRRGLGQAFGRVIRWGLASRSVYGFINALQGMVNTIADVESGIAILRQVMSPLQTDFQLLTDQALDFAKQFGIPIRQVIDAMRVFAQQGLAQAEVIDRTRTSMLAANTTTLTATDATEAITAATRVYAKEGESTVRFLDAWTEVEARHAITSGDLANALKKAAAVAKTSGVTFDEFNAIVTGIGETTRQTGKEIGTSLRFIFRRIQAEKGPKELAKIGIPVIAETGELRSAFDIFQDLAVVWTDLTNAQRLSIATAIGGRRHFNSLIVLMDHWNDVLTTLNDSLNSKGAAERRNQIVMDTYAKKLQQVRGALAELQVQFGRFALPVAKGLLTGLRTILETLANIPNSIKIAAVAFAGLFAIIAKGQTLVTGIIDRIRGFTNVFGDFGAQFAKQFKIGIFEIFGKLPRALDNIDTTGLSTITEVGKGIQDFESVLGKAGYAIAQFGRGWNSVMSEIAYTGTATTETLSKAFGKLGGGLATLGLRTAVRSPVLGGIITTLATGSKQAEKGLAKLAELFGIPAEALARWSQENASFVKSIGPLAGSIAALIPISGKTGDALKRLALSADDYEKSLSGLRRLRSSELADINSLATSYDRLQGSIDAANKARDPEAMERAIRREEYVSPVLAAGRAYDQSRDLGNQLAAVNLSLIDSFDKFGNAVVKPTANLKKYFTVMREAKIRAIAETEVKALEKFAEELTNAGSASAKFRSELRKFVKEIPGIGPVIAKQIKVSPAQELREAVSDVNKILAARENFPLSTAFDELFKEYNQRLKDARERFRGFYSDFRRILGGLETRGLGAAQIRGLLDREDLQPAFELMVEFEGRLKRLRDQGRINWKDILGIEILKRIEPDVSFDYAAELTKELFREAGILQRTKKAFVGDIVLFSDEIDTQFDIAGRQGILKYRDGLGIFVEAIDRELRTVKEIPFESVRRFVESIFPATKIADQLTENLDILREQLVGAAAGIVAIGDKEFRREFGLGARFFEQIPTETLIQTPIGYNLPGRGGPGGIGRVPFQANLLGIGFRDIIREYLVKPEEELKQFVEEARRRLEADKGFTKGLEEEITRFATIIKNNQVVAQFASIYVDLNKSLSESNRVLKENISVEQARNEALRETAGLLRDIPEAFTDLNLGIRDFFELTAQQRQLVVERARPPEQRTFTRLRGEIVAEELRRQTLADQLEQVLRARTQVGIIAEQARATGIVVPREDLQSITESVIKGISPGEREQIKLQESIKENTSNTVESLHDMLAALGDPKGQAVTLRNAEKLGQSLATGIDLLKSPRTRDRFRGVLGTTEISEDIKRGFDNLIKLRNLAEKRGNNETVRSIDAIITEQSRELVGAVGVRRARRIVEGEIPTLPSPQRFIREALTLREPISYLPGQFNFEQLISRAFGEYGIREVIQELEKAAGPTPEELKRGEIIRAYRTAPRPRFGYEPGLAPPDIRYQRLTGSSQFRNVTKLLNEQNKISVASSKTLSQLFAAYGGFNEIFRQAAKREQRGYDVQVKQLREQQKGVVVRFRAGEIGQEEFRTQMRDIARQISEAVRAREEAGRTAQQRATREAVGLIASATTTFARSAGFSEKALNNLGKSAAASVIAWQAWSALTGEELPEAVKRATNALNEYAATGGSPASKLRVRAAAKAVEKLEKNQKDLLNAEEKDKIRRAKDLKLSEEDLRRGNEALKAVKEGDLKKLNESEKLSNINRDQLTTLLAIEENTRKSSEAAAEGKDATEGAAKDTAQEMEKPIESMTQSLRGKLDEIKQERLMGGGDVAARLKDLFAAATVVTAAGYLGEKTRLPAELGEARRRAERLNESFAKLAQAFPKEVEAAIKQLRERREAALARGGATLTEQRTRLLDVARAEQEFLDRLSEMAESIGISLDDVSTIIESKKDKLYVIGELSSIISKSIDNLIRDVSVSINNRRIEQQFRLGLTGELRGLPTFEEFQIGKLPHELSPTERLLKEGGTTYRQLYDSFNILQDIRERLIGALQENAQRLVASQVGFTVGTMGAKRTIEDTTRELEKEGLLGLTKEDPTKIFTLMRKEQRKIPLFREVARRSQEQFLSLPEDMQKAQRVGHTEALAAINRQIRESRKFIEEYTKVLSVVDVGKALKEQREKLARFREIGKQITEQWRKGLIDPDIYAKTIPKINKSVIEAREAISGFEELGPPSDFRKAIADLIDRTAIASEQLRIEAENHEHLARAAQEVNVLMSDLAQVFEVGLNIERVIGEFEQLKFNLRVDDLHREFANLADDILSRLRGGTHPLAPQFPTFAAVQAGVPPEQLFRMTRAQQRIAEIQFTQGRQPTIAELQQIRFEEHIGELRLKQTREDEKLRQQFQAVVSLDRQIQMERLRAVNIEDPRVRESLLSSYSEFRGQLRAALEEASQIVREVEPGILERRGIDFDALFEKLKELRVELPEGIAERFDPQRVIRELALGEQAPVVGAIEESNAILRSIETNTRGLTERLVPGFLREERRKRAIATAESFVAGVRGEAQTGGTITGPGGPREDKVPILASPGEYIIRASSANKLGKQTLDYMNTTGTLPSGRRDPADIVREVERELGYEPTREQRMRALRAQGEIIFGKSKEELDLLFGKGMGGKIPYRYVNGGPTIEAYEEMLAKRDPIIYNILKYKDPGEIRKPRGEFKVGSKYFSLDQIHEDIGEALIPFHGTTIGMTEGQKSEYLLNQTAKIADYLIGLGPASAERLALKRFTSTLYKDSVESVLRRGPSATKRFDKLVSKEATKSLANYLRPSGKISKAAPAIADLTESPLTIRRILEEGTAIRPDIGIGELRQHVDKLSRRFPTMKEYNFYFDELISTIGKGKTAQRFMSVADLRKAKLQLSQLAAGTKLHPVTSRRIGDIIFSRKPFSKQTIGSDAVRYSVGQFIPGARVPDPKQIKNILRLSTMDDSMAELAKNIRHEVKHNADYELRVLAAFAKKIGVEDPLLKQHVDTLKDIEFALGLVRKGKISERIFPRSGGMLNPMEAYATALEKPVSRLPLERRTVAKLLQQRARLQKESDAALETLGKTPTRAKLANHPMFESFRHKFGEAENAYRRQFKSAADVGIFFGEGLRGGGRIFRKYPLGGLIPYYQDGGKTIAEQINFGDPTLEKMIEFIKGLFRRKPSAESEELKRIKEIDRAIMEGRGSGGRIYKYQQGTPYVPVDQMAMVHRGEAIIPAQYNIGGLVKRHYQAGGAVSPSRVLQGIESAAEKFGEAVVRKLEDATINFNIPTEDQLPELKIDTSNLEGVLEGFSVGAAGISKIDQFIESTTEKLDRLEEQTVTNSEEIKMVETKASEMEGLERELRIAKEQLEMAYLETQRSTDFVEDRSYVNATINESISDLKSMDITPIRSRITSLELSISNLNRELEDQRVIILSNISRLDLRG